jgi:hypothetical protein
MPRPIDPKGKTARLVLAPRSDQETKVRAFREICIRNKISISDELFKRVDEFLKEHHWPPGNSQVLMKEFLPTPVGLVKPLQCHFCKKDAVGYAIYMGRGKWPFCSGHLEKLKDNPKWKIEKA